MVSVLIVEDQALAAMATAAALYIALLGESILAREVVWLTGASVYAVPDHLRTDPLGALLRLGFGFIEVGALMLSCSCQ